MKKLLIFSVVATGLFASNVALRKMYVEELLHYSVKLPEKFYNPFVIEENKTKPVERNISLNKQLEALQPKEKIIPKISLLSILNNKILIKINDTIKWVKVGDEIEGYKILKLLPNQSKIIVSYDKKIETIGLEENNNINIKIKVIK